MKLRKTVIILYGYLQLTLCPGHCIFIYENITYKI